MHTSTKHWIRHDTDTRTRQILEKENTWIQCYNNVCMYACVYNYTHQNSSPLGLVFIRMRERRNENLDDSNEVNIKAKSVKVE